MSCNKQKITTHDRFGIFRSSLEIVMSRILKDENYLYYKYGLFMGMADKRLSHHYPCHTDLITYSLSTHKHSLPHFLKKLKKTIKTCEHWGLYKYLTHAMCKRGDDDRELNDHLYQLFYGKKTKNITLMRRWISYYTKQYPKQIIAKVQPYLNSKKLTLEDWLRCVREGRRGGIMCVFLLSLSTGVHTVVHLKNNKLWSTLKTIPASHSEILKICDQHLAYLGFGIFLKLERKPIQTNILGTVTGIDNATQQLLLQSIQADYVDDTRRRHSAVGIDKTGPCSEEQSPPVQTELIGITPPSTKYTQPTSLTGTTSHEILQPTVTKASAAAGSVEQLCRLQAELNSTALPRIRQAQNTASHSSLNRSRNKHQTKVSVTTKGKLQFPPTKDTLQSTVSHDPSPEVAPERVCKKQPKVNILPFQVQLTRLSDKELQKYLHSSNINPATTSSRSSRLSPVITRSATRAKKPQRKKRLISGHPSKLNEPTYSFHIRSLILRRHRRRLYLKCRVRGCTLAYTSFKRLKDLNTHHRIYHPLIYYNCRHCRKCIYTPSTWRFHQYCQRPKLKKCTICNKFFLFESTLKQHRRSHSKIKMFRCIFGRCSQSYKHPQDLNQHVASHQDITFNCELCDKTFTQRCLLKRHEVVHTNLLTHVCGHCSKGFRHSAQLYRHKRKFHTT